MMVAARLVDQLKESTNWMGKLNNGCSKPTGPNNERSKLNGPNKIMFEAKQAEPHDVRRQTVPNKPNVRSRMGPTKRTFETKRAEQT
jgi:hypothetical protein